MFPQHVKLTYDTQGLRGVGDNFVVENMVILKEQQKLYQQGTDRAAAYALGEDIHSRLIDINSGHIFSGAAPSGAGPSLLGAASHNYGSLASWVEDIGAVITDGINTNKTRAREALEPLLYKLGQNQEAAIEWARLNADVRSVPVQYGLNETGTALEPIAIVRWRQEVARRVQEAGPNAQDIPLPDKPNLGERVPEIFEINNQEVRDLMALHIELNGARTDKLAAIRTAQGVEYNTAPDAFYPIPVNPKDYPFFALVTDDSITSTGHHRTLFATSEDELKAQISKLKENPHLRVRTKKEAEEYFSARGQWDYEKTLNANYLDVEAHRKGVSAPYIIPTDPGKIVDEMLSWHLQRETGLVREAVYAKYEVQFEELKRLGEEFTNIATSKFSNFSLYDYAEETVDNPFIDYVKTALAISKGQQYPLWSDVNKKADMAISRMFRRIDDVFEKSKSPQDLAQINNVLRKAGYKGAHYDESMEIFANNTPARGVLSTAVQKANSLLATVVLRWDALNAVNNAVSANVLLGAETKAVIRAVSRGDEEAVGALSKLTHIDVPNGGGAKEFTAGKLISNAMAKFHGDKEALEFYRANGYLTSIADQYRDVLDTLAFTGKESVKAWDGKLNGLFHKLKKSRYRNKRRETYR